MARNDVTFDQFLRAVHRRYVTLRIVERAGVGLLIACAVATTFVAVVLWRGGDDAWRLSGFALAAGALVGAVAGAVSRPSELDAASEADRQLETSDLLTTALTLQTRDDANDRWADAVRALAADRCRRHAPREVILRRLGVREWGGILLAVGFVAVLTALSSASREAVAARTPGNDAVAAGRAADRAGEQPIVELTDVTQTPPRQRRTELSPEDSSSSPTADDAASSGQKTTSVAAQPDARDTRAPNADASSPGAGASEATSTDPRSAAAERPKASERTGPIEGATTLPSGKGSPRAGIGRVARSNQDGSDAAGGVITYANGGATQSVTPWTSASWPQTVESAEQQVRSGRVPDGVRDLVRGYFDPAASGR